ncbi:MAG: hypothetical protein H6Q17_466 [Bacteroidetes bacterium]|nr:hypothetical protein [Bacteroidota bacterium]
MSGVYCHICCVFLEFEFANHYAICQGLRMYFSSSFVLGSTVKGNKVEHFTHTGSDTVAVVAFDLGCRKVGGGMGNHVVVDKVVVTGKKYLAHDIALIAVIFECVFGSQVIETMGVRSGRSNRVSVGIGAVTLNDFVTVFDKIERDFTAGFYPEALLRWNQEANKYHQTGFSTSDRAGQQYAFVEIDPELPGLLFVL